MVFAMPRNLSILMASVLFLGLSSIAARPAEGASARDNYLFYCAQCHGTTGKGDGPNATPEMPVSPRDLTSPSEMRKLTDEDIMNVIREGGSATSKSTLMPPFGATLTETEITALKDYLRKLCECRGR